MVVFHKEKLRQGRHVMIELRALKSAYHFYGKKPQMHREGALKVEKESRISACKKYIK